MAKTSLNGVLQRLRSLAMVQTSRDLADRELLERFLRDKDEAAFTVLLERHGPMVHGVCQRSLTNPQDAEDACQATFLVLARKAGSVKRTLSLASWLHGVARRVAANLKRDYARRRRRLEGCANANAPATAPDASWREVQAILDEELEQLAPRYRAPLLLCYLEGRTRDEAATQLGLSLGALHGRLERGRQLLRDRLMKRGVALSAALFAIVLSGAHGAALCPHTVISCSRAATLVAAGETLTPDLASAPSVALFEGVVKSMFFNKLKLGTILLAGFLVIATWIGGVFLSEGSAQDATAKPSAYLDYHRAVGAGSAENDEAFMRRLSKDLRGVEPTPTELHFFLSSKEANKREKLVDLFVKERETAKKTAKPVDAVTLAYKRALSLREVQDKDPSLLLKVKKLKPNLATLQKTFLQELAEAKDKTDVARVTQAHLDRLIGFVKDHPKHADAEEAMRQVALVYESQGKTVEAAAWRDKLRGESIRKVETKPAK